MLDAAKGALVVVLAAALAPGPAPVLAAVAAVVGHMYPVWLRFHGGKGVATGLGAFAPLAPLAAGGAVVAFALIAFVTRYVSLGSIAGVLALAGLALVEPGPGPVAAGSAFTAALIVFGHRSNLRRIVAGTERRAGRAKE